MAGKRSRENGERPLFWLWQGEREKEEQGTQTHTSHSHNPDFGTDRDMLDKWKWHTTFNTPHATHTQLTPHIHGPHIPHMYATYSHITHIHTHTTHTVFKILETKGPITGCCCPSLDHSHLKLPEQRGQTQVRDFQSHLFPTWHRSSWESGYSTYTRMVLYWSEGDKTDHFRAIGSPSQTLEVSVASGNWDWGWQVMTARPWLNQRA